MSDGYFARTRRNNRDTYHGPFKSLFAVFWYMKAYDPTRYYDLVVRKGKKEIIHPIHMGDIK